MVKCLEEGDGIEEDGSSARAIRSCENNEGQKVARGIYIYLIITSGGVKENRKVTLIK